MDKEKSERIQRIFNWVRFVILVLFLTFIFIGLSKAQTTNDFGMWISAGAEKKLSDRLNLGVSTELRLKDNAGSVDRWQLGVNGTYKVSKVLKLGAGYEFHLKKRMVVDEATETVPRHRLMFDITPEGKITDWFKLSLRERYQYTYMMRKGNMDASHEHHLRNRFKAEMTNSRMNGWSPFASVEMFNNLGKQFQVDEMRIAAGTSYKINAHHVIMLGYLLDLKRSAGGLGKALHVLTSGYMYHI